MQFWLHLQLAGLIPGNGTTNNGGTYTGFWDGSKGGSWDIQTPGYNVPAAPIANGGYTTLYLGFQDAGWPSGDYGNIIFLSGSCPYPNYCGWPAGMATGVLTAQQAYDIDSKIDDGVPGTGTVRTQQWSAGCTDSLVSFYDINNSVGIQYGVAPNQPICELVWMNAF